MESSTGPIRVSQRQPTSCTECTRRKTKCDRQTIPCSNCRKRGVPEKCRIERVLPTKELHYAGQVAALRKEMDSVNQESRNRIYEMEALLRGNRPAASSPKSPTAASRAGLTEASESRAETDPLMSRDEEDAEAATTLEYLAINRMRHEHRTEPFDDAPDADWAMGEMAESRSDHGTMGSSRLDTVSFSMSDPSNPSERESISTSPPATPYISDRDAFSERQRAARADIIARSPPASVGRALVRYDIEHVSWMHCCYHGPTFEAESDLFWDESGSEDVEVNWSFSALLFGVLMSAAYHLPPTTFATLFPSQKPLQLVSTYFEACEGCSRETDWSRSHSLYTVQCTAVIASAANHIGKADWYFTMLGATIRIAQALNSHRLGPDPPSSYHSGNARSIILREVRKRAWYHLLYQDAFHVPFNGACSINRAQFNTPPPIHCIDARLAEGVEHATVPSDVPTMDSHVTQLHRLALEINQAFSSTERMKRLDYQASCAIDDAMSAIRDDAPGWMRDETAPSPPGTPLWVDWQRKAYILSACHKVIVLHRPYFGRAIRGDQRYTRSRTACSEQANRILHLFNTQTSHQFRTTWTVSLHVVAASLVLLLVAAQQGNASDSSVEPVRQALEVLNGSTDYSIIAQKGISVSSSLITESSILRATRSGVNTQGRNAFFGKAEVELKRALDVFRVAQPIMDPETGYASARRSLVPSSEATDMDSPSGALDGTMSLGDSFSWMVQSDEMDFAEGTIDWTNFDFLTDES